MYMNKRLLLYLLTIVTVLFTGCTNTFMGTVLVLSFKDIILYVIIAFVMAILISFKSSGDTKKTFWTWFILSLLLTPLVGFIYLLVKVSSNK
jgi:hypothetical protein